MFGHCGWQWHTPPLNHVHSCGHRGARFCNEFMCDGLRTDQDRAQHPPVTFLTRSSLGLTTVVDAAAGTTLTSSGMFTLTVALRYSCT